ncbi:MAG TPA: Hsp20/alpha crystallin family protein [candidate division Zixibacteria bacterium]|nr:Hsp20/alpha crystallin family protein [candidate division Zixibacteria bacterium]
MTKLTLRTTPMLNVDRLVSDIFGQDIFRMAGEWVPQVDMSETKDELTVRAEVPGMDKESISVTLQDNVLILRGDRKQETEAKSATFHRKERSYGSFIRSFTLPTLVQEDKVKAAYKDGVLTITLPKAEEVRPKEILISVN